MARHGPADVGIGAGQPGGEGDALALGVPWGSGAERVAQLRRVVRAVRRAPGPAPRVVVAASRPHLLEVGGEVADTVALGLPPLADLHALRTATGVPYLAVAAEHARECAPVIPLLR